MPIPKSFHHLRYGWLSHLFLLQFHALSDRVLPPPSRGRKCYLAYSISRDLPGLLFRREGLEGSLIGVPHPHTLDIPIAFFHLTVHRVVVSRMVSGPSRSMIVMLDQGCPSIVISRV